MGFYLLDPLEVIWENCFHRKALLFFSLRKYKIIDLEKVSGLTAADLFVSYLALEELYL